MKGFLEYMPGDTGLHRLSPLTKLALAVLFCAAVFLSSSVLYAAFLLLVLVTVPALSGFGKRALRLLSFLLKFSLVLFLIQLLSVREGRALLTFSEGFFITDRGISLSLMVVLRLVVSALPLALIITVTPMGDLAGALVQKLGVPYKYAFSFTTAIRFIPIFAGEMAEIMEAQTARGVEFDTKNIFKKLRLILPLCLPLLISSVKRTEYIALSAELRGFSLRKRKNGYKSYRLEGRDALALAAGVLLAAAAPFVRLP